MISVYLSLNAKIQKLKTPNAKTQNAKRKNAKTQNTREDTAVKQIISYKGGSILQF
jgi:hypothetical protein